MSETWRVVCEGGEVREVIVTVDHRAPDGVPLRWKADAGDEYGYTEKGARSAVACVCFLAAWPVVEVVAPGARTADERVAAMREACVAEMTKLRDAFAETDRPRTPDYIRRHGWPPSVHVGDCIVRVRNLKETR